MRKFFKILVFICVVYTAMAGSDWLDLAMGKGLEKYISYRETFFRSKT